LLFCKNGNILIEKDYQYLVEATEKEKEEALLIMEGKR
jgi:hypothetical protein